MQPRAKTVLIIDDEDQILKSIAEIITPLGVTSIMKKSAEEALDGSVNLNEMDLILCDLSLEGGMDGASFLCGVKENHPDINCVIMTGWNVDKESYPFKVMEKPFSMDELKGIVTYFLN